MSPTNWAWLHVICRSGANWINYNQLLFHMMQHQMIKKKLFILLSYTILLDDEQKKEKKEKYSHNIFVLINQPSKRQTNRKNACGKW